MRHFEDLSPDPGSHIKTLMRIGYTLPSAISDILDNSIAAKTKVIKIFSPPGRKEPIITILDDGEGMSPSELIDNMRIGCKDPLLKRDQGDLGRFGSGMKTASFSQARRLTVVSKKKGHPISAATWDIDTIERHNSWSLEIIKGEELDTIPCLEIDNATMQGTQIIWENLSCVSTGNHTGSKDEELASQLSSVKSHIALHFHRFLQGKNSIEILINGKKIIPIDPFLIGLDGYQEGREEKFRCIGGVVEIKTHVLPHIKRIPEPNLNALGGAEGISRNQGIYIYREKRLINAGGWLGLATNNQLGALARVQVDIPSTMDHEWSTDVKKSSLQIPSKVKRELKKYLSDPIKKSKKAFTYRGKQEKNNDFWTVREDENNNIVTYHINTKNEALLNILKNTQSDYRRELIKYLGEISENLPINHIYQKMSSSPNNIKQQIINTTFFEKILNNILGSYNGSEKD
jgi:hypothetical protein